VSYLQQTPRHITHCTTARYSLRTNFLTTRYG